MQNFVGSIMPGVAQLKDLHLLKWHVTELYYFFPFLFVNIYHN